MQLSLTKYYYYLISLMSNIKGRKLNYQITKSPNHQIDFTQNSAS